MRYFILALIFVVALKPVEAQFYPLPHFNHEWSDQQPIQLGVDPAYTDYPAVVLRDKRKVSVRGRKEEFIHVYFERKQRIKIQSLENGAMPFSRIQLPESLDPFYDCRNLPLSERSNGCSPDYFNVQIVFFAARKILNDSSYVNLNFNDNFVVDQIEIGERFEEQFRYVFNLMDIEIGDHLEIHYKVEVPFAYNWFLFNSQRIFFHGNYPVQNQRTELVTHKHLRSEIRGTQPDSVYTRKKRTHRVWRNTSISGCISEKGIRPSSDLPHIVYSLHTANPRLQGRNHLSGQLLPANYTLNMFKYRERNALWLRMMASRSSESDEQWRKVRSFMAKTTDGIPPGEPLIKLNEIHSTIVNDFSYKKDDAVFAELDMGLERMGDFVQDSTLREISRYNLYAKVITHLGLKYYPVYMLDKRIGSLARQYPSNILFSDFSFAVPDGDYLNLYYPKSEQFGYEVNEYPFYLAGSRAFIVDVDRLTTEDNYFPSLIDLPLITDDNYRNTVVHGMVNTAEGVVKGSIELDLSGQFSALTRSLYDFGEIDSSINPMYGRKVFHNRKVEYENTRRVYSNSNAPYERSYSIDYELKISESAQNGGLYKLSLKGFFPFIYWEEFDEYPRQLPFYGDFMGVDIIQFNLVFDRPVEIENEKDLTLLHTLENRYGSMVLSIDQPEPKQVTIKAYYNQFAERVEPGKAHLISELYNGIRDLNEAVLRIRLSSD